VALIEQEFDRSPEFTGSHRVYTSDIGPSDVVVIEFEFADMQDRSKTWEIWGAKPSTATLLEKWYELTERGGTREIWNLAAHR
jgi:hypothetical protein